MVMHLAVNQAIGGSSPPARAIRIHMDPKVEKLIEVVKELLASLEQGDSYVKEYTEVLDALEELEKDKN